MALLDAISFGIGSEAAGFTATESASMTSRMDKVEATDEDGEFASFSYYNANGEFSATGYGTTTASLGTAITALGGLTAGGSVFCSEVTVEESAEDFAKSSVKGQFWSGIS
tara:strand:+ start:2563 stop:2895 length:333 start_codon:yes stop_codon:yes gene_type:complete